MTITPTTKNWRGPCDTDPQAWDLDAGTLTGWLGALRICAECPVQQLCKTEILDVFWPDADPRKPRNNPNGVILAGVAYSENGRPMDRTRLTVMASRRRNQEKKRVLEEAAATAALQRTAS